MSPGDRCGGPARRLNAATVRFDARAPGRPGAMDDVMRDRLRGKPHDATGMPDSQRTFMPATGIAICGQSSGPSQSVNSRPAMAICEQSSGHRNLCPRACTRRSGVGRSRWSRCSRRRWFVDMDMTAAAFHPTTFTKNRERLMDLRVARQFFALVVGQAEAAGLMSSEPFSVDGTLIEAWASLKSLDDRPGGQAGAQEQRQGGRAVVCPARADGEPQRAHRRHVHHPRP